MKKKVLFLHYEMHLGGIETALVAALRILDPSKYDVTLMLTKRKGVMLSQIPEHVNIVEMPFTRIGRWRMDTGFVRTVLRCALTLHWCWAARMTLTKLRWFLLYKRKGLFMGELDSVDMVALIDRSRLPQGMDFALAYSGGYFQALAVTALFPKAVTAIWFHDEHKLMPFKFQRDAVNRCDYRFACSKSMACYLNDLYSSDGLHFDFHYHPIRQCA